MMTAPTTTLNRSVQFAETDQTLEFDNDQWEDLRKDELWLSKELCHENKERCAQSGRHWRRKGYDILLNDCYEKPARGTQSKINALAAINPDDYNADAANHHCVPRGIERFISPKHADERRYAKVHCVESVVDVCTYMKRQNKSLDEIEVELHDLSVKQSKRSRDFARRLGHADAKSVREQRQVQQQSKDSDDDEVSVISVASSVVSVASTARKVRKGISTRALMGTRKLTRMITGNSFQAQR